MYQHLFQESAEMDVENLVYVRPYVRQRYGRDEYVRDHFRHWPTCY